MEDFILNYRKRAEFPRLSVPYSVQELRTAWPDRTNPFAMRKIAWLFLCSCMATPAWADGEEARVLILNGLDPYLPAYMAIDSAMRAHLAKETKRRIVLYSEPLDAQRFSGETLEPEVLALLSKKYKTLRIDVVVTVMLPALNFYERHGETLWPGSRLVFHGIPDLADEPRKLPPAAIGQVNRDDFEGTVRLARRMQPNARRILVVGGASPLDLELERRARQLMPALAGGIDVQFLSGLPLPDLVTRVQNEPADTIILYLTQFRDRDGRPYLPREVLRAMSSVSAAPIYGLFETYVGAGVAAGNMEFYEDRGRLVGQLVSDALAGMQPTAGNAVFGVPSRCVADARALQRWSLDEDRLPTGCDVRFAERPLWRQYWWQLTLAVGVLLAQSALIVALLQQRRRRHEAEAESRTRLAEMAHMNRRVAMGNLAASIAHELNQPLGAIYNNAGAAEILIKANPPKLRDVAEILDDIKQDDKRASEVIARIRTMLRKTDVDVEDVDLNAIIGDTVKLLAADAAAKGISLTTMLDPELPPVRADRVQVQQVLINLALNAIEALEALRDGKRQLSIRSGRADDKDAEVTVTDTGPGIDADLLPRMFDAFVTSKSGGMGLGLSISRTIVEAHGGRLSADNGAVGGAVFRFTLPFATATNA